MIIGFVRGHEMYFDEVQEKWFYSDDDSMVPLFDKDIRSCIKCNLPPTKEGYDACLGKIEGAIAACCGHGVDEGYVKYPE